MRLLSPPIHIMYDVMMTKDECKTLLLSRFKPHEVQLNTCYGQFVHACFSSLATCKMFFVNVSRGKSAKIIIHTIYVGLPSCVTKCYRLIEFEAGFRPVASPPPLRPILATGLGFHAQSAAEGAPGLRPSLGRDRPIDTIVPLWHCGWTEVQPLHGFCLGCNCSCLSALHGI